MSERGHRKTREGTVTSTKMDKTIVVEVVRQVKHPRYSKYIKRNKNYMVHDEENKCNVGDKVVIVESKPLSKNKRWRVRYN